MHHCHKEARGSISPSSYFRREDFEVSAGSGGDCDRAPELTTEEKEDDALENAGKNKPDSPESA